MRKVQAAREMNDRSAQASDYWNQYFLQSSHATQCADGHCFELDTTAAATLDENEALKKNIIALEKRLDTM